MQDFERDVMMHQMGVDIPDPNPDQLKFCRRCDQAKPRSEFGFNRTTKDGLQSYCKECMSKLGKNKKAKEATAPATKDYEVPTVEVREVADPAAKIPPPESNETYSDKELVDLLRARGYEVTARKTIEL